MKMKKLLVFTLIWLILFSSTAGLWAKEYEYNVSGDINIQKSDPNPGQIASFVLPVLNAPETASFDTAGGIFTYAPGFGVSTGASNQTYADVTFRAKDNFTPPETTSLALSIAVIDSNSAPKWDAAHVDLSAKEQRPCLYDLKAVFSGDDESDAVAFSATLGTIGTDTVWSWTPGWGDAGAVVCTVTARDDHVPAAATPLRLAIAVADSNRAPIAQSDIVTTDEDTAVPFQLSATDPDGETNLTWIIIDSTHFGTLSGTAPDLTYAPDTDFAGRDSLRFRADDGTDTGPAAYVVIVVGGQNDPPSLTTNTGATVAEGASVTIDATMLRAVDTDNTAAEIIFTVETAPGNGLLLLEGATPIGASDTFAQEDIDNSRISYEHDGSETTGDSFEFTATDGAGGTIVAQNFSLTVTKINDDPALSANTGLTLDEGASATVTNTMLEVEDVDNTAMQITYTIGTAPADGNLKLSGSNLSAGSTFTQDDIDNSRIAYQHDGAENHSLSFTFTVSDGSGGTIATQTFNIDVYSVNDAPNVSITTPTDNTSFLKGGTVAIEASASDVDGTIQKVEFYRDGDIKLGEDPTSPYRCDWNAATAGSYALTARAIDDSSDGTTSSGVNVNIHGWEEAGTARSSIERIDLSQTSSGTPYLALADGDNNDNNTQYSVDSLNGSTWVSLGTIATWNWVNKPSLCISHNNKTYMALMSGINGSDSIEVYEYQAGNWNIIGSDFVETYEDYSPCGLSDRVSLSASTSAVLYLSYVTHGHTYWPAPMLWVKKYDGSSWTWPGTEPDSVIQLDILPTDLPSAVSPLDGTHYVAYNDICDCGAPEKIKNGMVSYFHADDHSYSYSDTMSTVSISPATDDNGYLDMTVTSNGNVYVASIEVGASSNAAVRLLTTGGWTYAGGSGPVVSSGGNVENVALSSNADTVYLAFVQSGAVYVKRLVSGTWSNAPSGSDGKVVSEAGIYEIEISSRGNKVYLAIRYGTANSVKLFTLFE